MPVTLAGAGPYYDLGPVLQGGVRRCVAGQALQPVGLLLCRAQRVLVLIHAHHIIDAPLHAVNVYPAFCVYLLHFVCILQIK